MVRPREHTHEEFVDAAIRIVDAEGLEALTLRRLGAEVGASFTAMYTYFATREDLITALVDRIADEVITGIERRGDSARDQLMSIGLSARRALERHPQLAGVFATSTKEAEQGNDATLVVVGLLESAGLTGRDLVTAYRIIESYVFGTSVFDFGAAPEHLAIRRRRYLASGLPEFGAVAKSDKSVGEHNDEAFEKGLELILSSLGL